MENRPQKTDQDILDQRYRGPSPLVAGAGEGFLQGKFLLVTGIVAGAIAGALFPTPIGEFVNRCRTKVSVWQKSENLLLQGSGDISQWLLKSGEGVVDFIRKLGNKLTGEKLVTHEHSERWGKRIAAAVDTSILASAALWIAGIFTGIFSGTRSSHRGERQFKDAQTEIKSLRDDNNQLRDKLIETQFALDDYKTVDNAKHGTLKVSPDDTPRMQSETAVAPVNSVSLRDLVHTAPRVDLTSDIVLG